MRETEGRATTMERPPLTGLIAPFTGRSAKAAPGPDNSTTTDPAFETLYRREFGAVVSVVHSLTGRRDLAEEITQDAFVITHDRWHRIRTYDRPADFVRRVALNRALSSLRRRQAEHRALERWQGRATTVGVPDVKGDDDSGLWAAVRRLPARQAQVVALLYVEDQPIAGIARILDCTENTVKTHLKRARAALAAELGDDGGNRDGNGHGEGRDA